ncbi:MAG: hypothetical protein IKG59_01845 [Firmicutes bacterium]|nr:hypothetical protein [Bacillota bacterium]
MNGWIKLHRKLMDNPIITQDAEYLSVWIHLLMLASHNEHDIVYQGQKYTLKPGQLVTGRRSLGKMCKVDQYKVARILKCFENEQQIAQQNIYKGRLISVKKWDEYQLDAPQNAHQMHHTCTTDAPQMHHTCTTDAPQMHQTKEGKELNNNNKYINAHTREDDSETYHPYSGYEYSGRPIPTQNDVRAYFKEQDFKSSPDRFFWHHHGRGWNGVSDWQAMAQEWEMRYQERKETNAKKSAAWIPSTQRDDSEYGSMSDLEAMLLSRSVDDVVAGLRKEQQV